MRQISSQAPRKFTCEVARHMNYEDFVYFLISVEDKSSEPSVEYWYACLFVMYSDAQCFVFKAHNC